MAGSSTFELQFSATFTYLVSIHLQKILVIIVLFVIYATFWKVLSASSQSRIIIKQLGQLNFIYYHRSWSNNIFQGVCKFGIFKKIYCVWNNGQNFWQFWYKILNLLLEVWCIWPSDLVIAFVFHNLTCWRCERFSVPYAPEKIIILELLCLLLEMKEMKEKKKCTVKTLRKIKGFK